MTADIERLAREAGIDAIRHVLFRRERGQGMTRSEAEAWASVLRFAALVRADERERAAKHITETSADTYGVLLREHGEAAGWLRALPPSP